jgi:hypothetical protein
MYIKRHFVKRLFFVTHSAIFTYAIHWARRYSFQASRTNDYEHIHNRNFNVKELRNDYKRDYEVYAFIIRDWCSKNSQITWWSRYCKITRKLEVQRQRQRANVNNRIAIQSSRYELSWTISTDIWSFTTSNELRVTMSEILLRDLRFSIFDLI